MVTTQYPTALPTTNQCPTGLQDNVDDVLVAQQNPPHAEILAIATELGTLPKGDDADVKSRLDRIDVPWQKAKALAQFSANGGIVTNYIENVSVIQSGTTGRFRVDWTIPFATTHYVYIITAGGGYYNVSPNAHTPGYIDFYTLSLTGLLGDSPRIMIAAFGDQ